MREPTLLERVATVEAESRRREDLLLKIQADVVIAKAKSAAEIGRLQASLDAERAKSASLAAQSARLLASLQSLIRWRETEEYHTTGDPTHSHGTPGCWDDDGSECESCKIWNDAAIAAVQPTPLVTPKTKG